MILHFSIKTVKDRGKIVRLHNLSIKTYNSEVNMSHFNIFNKTIKDKGKFVWFYNFSMNKHKPDVNIKHFKISQ